MIHTEEPTWSNGDYDKCGSATFFYEVPADNGERAVSRNVRIGICSQCFNVGPCDMQCDKCDEDDIESCCAIMKTVTQGKFVEINPIQLSLFIETDIEMAEKHTLERLHFNTDPLMNVRDYRTETWTDEMEDRVMKLWANLSQNQPAKSQGDGQPKEG